ncbi:MULTISPECIES: UvrD-helicase domain-containing protein [Chryseobacterium]|uniref:DNA 3'-5' helicase n=3 Tax=Chryseobacterium TaxID=59732 RepID=A0A1M5GWN9_9FLAO|nr:MULTISPECIES: UvrD-helicase domain-containing protein [Chryseobacterium]EFK35740.1 UvrD/REP helicase [Chryseobacterium gleum ATCC 35910]QQY31477.1 ATP-dependent helicase [Chryseobacterium gleum]SHG08194.1 Superfamily I DNA or RNA helicase [Chryseobacterium vrystaatense]VEE11841.1 DNA helicase II [Chryseobacterium gleum]
MIFDKLNDEQRVAVTQSGNVLLTACPGSGKTRVIIHKLAYELDQLANTSKKKIAAVTFTVRASEEIFKRLNAMGINSDKIWSGTLHSFCLEWILRPYSCYLPELQNGFSMADESYCDELISSLKVKYKLKPIDPVNMRFDRNGNFLETKIIQKRLLEDYHSILKRKKLIDFELILFYSYKILQDLPRIPQILSKLFKIICIDEYQDTQDLLYAIISTIVRAGNGETSAFFVGDTDQAIYSSLGGVAKNIEQIKEELNDLPIEPLTLKGNYRSSQRIIDFYRQFQTQSIDIKAVGINAKTKGLITLNNTIDKAGIVEEISKLILLSLDKGIPEDEICVLVPQWWLITSISKKLRAVLPNVNFDASGLAPMARNRENIWFKLSRLFLTQPSPKLYSLRYRWAAELIDNFRIHTFSDLTEEYRNERSFLRLINSIKSNEIEGIDYLKDCFDQFLNIVGIDYKKNPTLVESWELFFTNIKKRLNDPEYVIPSDIQSFKSFYREMTGVVINTCVGIKGEEFETVIAYGLLNGYIPHWNEIFSGNANEASKKLLYVICSRAKTNLHLISETGRTTKRGDALTITSELEAVNFKYDNV